MRFLLVTPIYTASRLTGGGQRTILLYRALLQIGEVDLVLISEEVCQNFEQELGSFRDDFPETKEILIVRSTPQFLMKPEMNGPLVRIKYLIDRLIHAVRPRSHFYHASTGAKVFLSSLMARNHYDAIVGRYLQATALSGALDQVQVPVIVDLDDLDEIILTSRIKAHGTSRLKIPALHLHLWQTIPVVKKLRDRCRHLFVSTADDLPMLGERPVTVLPNIPFPSEAMPAVEEDVTSKIILFVGSFGHRVNREGIDHFSQHCWPDILRRVPGARFRIVGSGGWDTARGQFESVPGIQVVGKVDDLHPEYEQAAISVSPIFEGAGTKIKILESLCHARVVVAAAYSVRGFNESALKGVVLVRSDQEMVDQCVFMLNNPATRRRLSIESQEIIAQSYSFASIQNAVKIAVDCVCSRERRDLANQ